MTLSVSNSVECQNEVDRVAHCSAAPENVTICRGLCCFFPHNHSRSHRAPLNLLAACPICLFVRLGLIPIHGAFAREYLGSRVLLCYDLQYQCLRAEQGRINVLSKFTALSVAISLRVG